MGERGGKRTTGEIIEELGKMVKKGKFTRGQDGEDGLV